MADAQIGPILAKLEDFKKRLLKALEQGLLEEAQQIAEEARTLAPVDTGWLRDSVFADSEGTHAVAGFAATYAPDVHELHKTRSEFLAEPAYRGRQGSLGEKVKTALGGGSRSSSVPKEPLTSGDNERQ